jgi:organic radical activating enzyme
VETNGTVHPLEGLNLTLADGTVVARSPLDPTFVNEISWVISPKFGTSKQAVNPAVLTWWASQPNTHFKFVVGSPDDLSETEHWVGHLGLAPKRVWLMPEGLTRESQIRPDLAEAAVAHGWNLSLRVHTLLWGNEKGR